MQRLSWPVTGARLSKGIRRKTDVTTTLGRMTTGIQAVSLTTAVRKDAIDADDGSGNDTNSDSDSDADTEDGCSQ